MPPELIALPIPPGCGALWSLFLDLHARRGNSGTSLLPIALADLLAWQQLFGVRLTSWEIDTLMQLDAAALAAHTETDTTL